MSTAAEKVAAATSLTPTFPVPKAGFEAGTGTIAVIAGGLSAPVHAEQAEVMKKAVTAAGWTVLGPYDGKFSPAVQGGYIDQAIQARANGVLLFAVDVNTIRAAVDRALGAKIVVACAMCTSGDQARAKGVLDVTPDFERQGEDLGWFIVQRSKGAAKVAITVEPAATGVVARTRGLEKVLDQCAGCSYNEIVIPAADSTLPGPPQWTAFLSAHPSGYTDAVAYYDGLTTPMTKTLRESGRTDVTVSSYDADPAVLSLMAKGSAQLGADVASPLDFASWSAVDLVLRSKAGAARWDTTNLPSVLLTGKNIAGFTPPLQPAGDWHKTFTTLWTSS
ncbi:sugar ABC transporter substrate-binding protein [Frankia canadensis]|nr:substrate-binding domain-containing protein [Frankia canadensis]